MNYWLLSSGKDGELWPTFWYEKVIAVGWSSLGDLRRYRTRDEMKAAFAKAYPGSTPKAIGNNVSQVWGFFQRLQKAEIVFVRSYGAIIGIAEIQGDYEFLSEGNDLRKRLYSPFFKESFCHIRRVRWLSLWGGLKQNMTFTRLTLMP